MIYQANITISSNLLEIKNVVEDLLTSIKDIIKEENLLFDMKLILNELIINSAVHGNTLDENKKINLNLEIDENVIKIEVEDEGEGFVYDKNKYDPLALTSNGRGLVIVDGLSDKLSINNNRVEVVKYIS